MFSNDMPHFYIQKMLKVAQLYIILQKSCMYLVESKNTNFAASTAPEMNISPVLDIVSGSRHFVPVTRNSCWSSVYDVLLKFEKLPVIVTGRKRILSVTHEIVSDSDR